MLVQRQREAKRLDAARIRVAANWARMRVRACVAAWKQYAKTAKADRAHERRLFARAAEFFRAGSVRAYFERWCGFVDRAYGDRKATRRAVLLWQHARIPPETPKFYFLLRCCVPHGARCRQVG